MTEIKDVEYPTDVIAGILGVTRARIRQLTKDGMPKSARNSYPMIACIRWYIEWWKKRATMSDTVLARHKRRLLKAQADSAVLDAKMKKGEMLLAEDVKKDAFNFGRRVRDAMLSIPDRLADQLAVETDSAEIHKKMLAEIRRAIKGVVTKE